MGRVYVFADESGNFDFSRKKGASRYFGVGTIALRDGQPSALRADLLRLRTEMAWRDMGLDSTFHATTDSQAVRDEVFPLLASHPLRIDVTLLEKSKAQPQVRSDEPTFYKYAWYYHLKHLVTNLCASGDQLMVIAAELGTRAKRAAFRRAVDDVAQQCAWYLPHRVAFWPANSDPCLRAADYCLWAVTRKWESGDPRSHVLIAHQIASEFDLWAWGKHHYY